MALFLTQANVLPPDMGLALYVSIGGADWAYRGFVSNQHPSEVMPLSWPEPPGGHGLAAPPGPGYAQLGISLEPLGELGQKEGSKLGAREDFAKCVGLDLFNFMQVRFAVFFSHVAWLAAAPPTALPTPMRPTARPPVPFVQSFGGVQAVGGDKLLVPANILDHWYQRLSNRLRRDPDFLTRRRDAV